MKNKFLIVILLLASVTYSAFAMPLDSIGVAKIDDKMHVKYLVSPGETIYGISTKYGVPVSDLMEINPQLENGLKVGQVINIPYNPALIKPVKKADDNVIVHKVQPGETFYALSKKYNTTVGDLMRINNMELKAGQEIIVGYKNEEKKTPVEEKKTTVVNTNTTTTENKTQVNTTTTENKTQVNTTNTGNETKTNEVNNTEVKTNDAQVNKNNPVDKTETANKVNDMGTPYPYDPTKKQVLVIPFDPYLYFSDADDEIAARSDMPRTKVRQVFRKRLNAMLDVPGYETIHLLGGKGKDSLTDLNKIYASVTYNYQQSVVSPYYKPAEDGKVEVKKNKNWLEKQKDKIANPSESKYDIPEDHGSYFGVLVKSADFYSFFNAKYSVDYYIFVSQFEVKTNYEHCLDRAAQNYERTFVTHFSIFDSTGKQIAGNKFKTHYNSNSNYVYQIVADNIEKIANRIIAEMPAPNQ